MLKDRRSSEVEILTALFGAVLLLLRDATAVPQVGRRKLPMPQLPAGVHVQSQHCIGGIRRRGRIVIPGRNVNYMPLQISGRSRPYRCAGWSPVLNSLFTLAQGSGGVVNRVGLPDLLAGRGVESNHGSSKRTAWITRVRSRAFLPGGDRNIESFAHQQGGTCDSRGRVRLGMGPPSERTICGPQGVDVAIGVAEECERTLGGNRNRSLDRPGSPKRPPQAAGRRIQ